MTDKPKGPDAIALLEYERAKRTTMDGLCSAAAAGDTDEAKHLLKLAHAYLVHQGAGLGANMPPELAMYIGQALGRIAQGEDPAAALHLKPPKYPRPNYWRLERDADLARAVQRERDADLARAVQRLVHPPVTLDDAAIKIAEGLQGYEKMVGRVGAEAVRKAYLRFSKDRGKR